MELLRNYKEWRAFEKKVNSSQPQAPIQKPSGFPCFAYLVTASFGYEEEAAEYLYPDELAQMLADALKKET